MRVNGTPMRTIWPSASRTVMIIDQTQLPHQFAVVELKTLADAAHAIKAMLVRGAPLIGVTAAYGVALALDQGADDGALHAACALLAATRPTAVNLHWALSRVDQVLRPLPVAHRADAAWDLAAMLADEDVVLNQAIGRHGVGLIESLWARNGRNPAQPVNILTHCNAGWLATVDVGTATAPIYAAFDAGIPVHVWVDETRPRNQGAGLTARELNWHGVPHTVIVDNAGGHLMQHGLVDLCIVGTDRTTATGDVANKIGTYLKALAAYDNQVPFYVALPSPTIDWTIRDGVRDIPIEQRASREVTHIAGISAAGILTEVAVTPLGSPARNDAFDVTPARLVTALITERGICPATEAGLAALFPERVQH